MVASDNMLIHGQDCLGLNPHPGHLKQAVKEVLTLSSNFNFCDNNKNVASACTLYPWLLVI